MRHIAFVLGILGLSLVLTACGGGGGGSNSQPNPCADFEVRLVIEHFLPQIQSPDELLPFQSGLWGITDNGSPTYGGTVFLRDPNSVVTTLTIDPPETGRYFSPDVPGTWEMWGTSSSACTTRVDTFYVFPFTVDMTYDDKFIPVGAGQDWGIVDASTGTGIPGTLASPVALTFFDVVGNLVDLVTIDTGGTLKFYTPMGNPLEVGFVVGMTASGEITPIRQFNLVDGSCDLGFNFPGFIIPKGLPQQFDIALFGAGVHFGGSFIVRHDGDTIQTTPIYSNETSFSWTPPYDGRFTIELSLQLPCGSRSSIPYPVRVW